MLQAPGSEAKYFGENKMQAVRVLAPFRGYVLRILQVLAAFRSFVLQIFSDLSISRFDIMGEI